jgi:hypothetical protein
MSSPGTLKLPADFPRFNTTAALAGVQPKLATVLSNGMFSEGLADEELFQRYVVCEDLLTQLESYCRRKLNAMPGLEPAMFRANVRQGVLNKRWGLSVSEMDWVMSRLCDLMNWPSGNADHHSDGLQHRQELVRGVEFFELSDDEAMRVLSGRWNPPMIVVRTKVSVMLEKLGHERP